MGKFAWVTLATNDSYSMGALVLVHSLRRVNTAHQLVILVTPGVTEAMKTQLSAVFNVVKLVDVLDSRDADNLALLARPELGITFTKLHCWKLTEYEKCVFLDADTLVLQNSDELFEREELSAAPDAGWPDCFNSGVFVYKPSQETFKALIEFALIHGSFDGGDQGLLNLFFSDWPTKDIQKHLPFIYNMCATATYSYLPAFKQFGAGLKIIHFIGATKPWLQPFNTETGLVSVSGDSQHTTQFVQLWWDIFCAHVHPSLSTEMAGLAAALATVTLGAPISVEQRALEEHLRRQGWEQGNIDYMGKDSFANIWNKICETMGTPAPPGGLALGIPTPSGGVPEPPSPAPVAPVAAPVYVSSVEISSSGQIDKTPPQPIYAPVSAILPTVESSDTKDATKEPVSESSTVVPEQKPSVTEVVPTETSVTPSVTLETSTPAPQLASEPPAAQQPPLEPTVKTDSAAVLTEAPVTPAATPAAKEEAIIPPVTALPVAEPFTSTPLAQPPTDAPAPTPLPTDAPVPTVPSLTPLPTEAAAPTTPIQTPVPTDVPVFTTAAPTAAPIATTVPTAAPVPTEPIPTAAPVSTATPVPTTPAAAPTEPPVPTLPPTETPVSSPPASAPSDSALPTPPVSPPSAPTPSAPAAPEAPGDVPAPAPAKVEPAQPQTPTVTGPTPPLSPAAAADVPQIAKLQVEADIPATPPVGASPQPLEGAVGEDPPVPPKRKGGSKAPQDPKNQKGGKPQPKGKK